MNPKDVEMACRQLPEDVQISMPKKRTVTDLGSVSSLQEDASKPIERIRVPGDRLPVSQVR
jgi:hypothetical protein